MSEDQVKDTSPELDEINAFLADIHDENDRATVIVSAAKLDLQLTQIIQKFLLPSPSSRDDLLEVDGPLGSFNSRINFLYRVGLIEPAFARALHLVRRIRNDFAHEPSNSSLNSGSHRDRVREFVAPFDHSPVFREDTKKFFEKDDPASTFRMAAAIMSIRLGALFAKCTTIVAPLCYDLVPPKLFKK